MLPKRQHLGFQEFRTSVNVAKKATNTENRSKTCSKCCQKGNIYRPGNHRVKVNDNIQIHCHPWYKMKEEWFDWIQIKWEYANSDIQYVPARVMQILDLRSIDGKIADHYEPGIYLCIISLKRSTKKVGKSHVIYKGAYKRMEDHKIRFRIVEISSVHSFCFAVPDCATLEDKDILECDQWLFVENRRDWAKHFLHIK